jgi:methyl-accepting chemotaxis protein
MKTKQLSLGSQILLLCMTIIVVIAGAVSFIYINGMNRITQSTIKAQAEASMFHLEAAAQSALAPGISMTETIASFANTIASPEELEAIITVMLPTNQSVFEIYYGTTVSRFDGGWFVTATDWAPYSTSVDWDQIKRPWFITAMANQGNTVITDPYVDSSTGKICITITRTASDAQGRVTGAVGIDMFLDTLTTLVNANKVTEDGNSFLIDGAGLYITHTDQEAVMNKNFFDDQGAGLDKDAILANDVVVALRDKSYVASIPVVGTSWHLVSLGSTKSWTQANDRLLLMLGAGLLALALIVLVITLIMSKRITAPFRTLADAFTVLAKGDLTVSVEDKRKTFGSKEAAMLADVFKGLTESLGNLVRGVKTVAEKLADIGTELSTNMTQTAGAVVQVTGSIKEVQQRVINQSASVTETSATMESITGGIEKLSANIEKQNQSVAQSTSAIEEMLANIDSVTATLAKNAEQVKNLSEASGVGQSGLQEVAQDIEEIAKESEGLLEINSVMENIASQTNLLSMNAAIEAAHAGEAGKGFAVVADEIRKLAESSSEQSKTIVAVIKKIKQSIDKISSATRGVLGKFDAITLGVATVKTQEDNVLAAMEEQGIGSKQILQSISDLTELTRTVRDGSTEMLNGSKQVITESQNLQSATAEISRNMNDMSSGAGQINAAVANVSDMAEENKAATAALEQEIAKFTVN